jgi:hypothetical protein
VTLFQRVLAPFLYAAAEACATVAFAVDPDEGPEGEDEGAQTVRLSQNGHHEAEITRREQT